MRHIDLSKALGLNRRLRQVLLMDDVRVKPTFWHRKATHIMLCFRSIFLPAQSIPFNYSTLSCRCMLARFGTCWQNQSGLDVLRVLSTRTKDTHTIGQMSGCRVWTQPDSPSRVLLFWETIQAAWLPHACQPSGISRAGARFRQL